MLEEEIAFTKMAKRIKLPKNSGLNLCFNDKLNAKTAEEIVETLREFETIVVRVILLLLTGDVSEVRKVGESKDLVFAKMLVN